MNRGALGLPGAPFKGGGVPANTLLSTVQATATPTSNNGTAYAYGSWVQIGTTVTSTTLVIPSLNSLNCTTQFGYGPSSSALTVVWTGIIVASAAIWPFCIPPGQGLWVRIAYALSGPTVATVAVALVRNPSSPQRVMFNRRVFAAPPTPQSITLGTTLASAVWAPMFSTWDTITPTGQVQLLVAQYGLDDAQVGRGSAGNEVAESTATTDGWFKGTGTHHLWAQVAMMGDRHIAQIRFNPGERVVTRQSWSSGGGTSINPSQAIEVNGTIPV